RHADGAARVALDDRHDRRQGCEAVEHETWLGAAHDDRETVRDIAPAPRISGGLSAERRGDRLDELACPVDQEPAPRPRLTLARERFAKLRLRLGAEPGDRRDPALFDCGPQL